LTDSPVSPKQRTSEGRRDWYPYYAGFTEQFANEVLAGPLRSSGLILDPWSGSGTTGAASARRGLDFIGVDVNPVLTIIAKARLTPFSLGDSLLPLAKQIGEAARQLDVVSDEQDLLRKWMRSPTVRAVRAIQEAIHLILTSDQRRPQPANLEAAADQLPLLACFFYTALFASVRDLLSRFRSTNPTWIRDPASVHQRIGTSWASLLDEFQYWVGFSFIASRQVMISPVNVDASQQPRLRRFRLLPNCSTAHSPLLRMRRVSIT